MSAGAHPTPGQDFPPASSAFLFDLAALLEQHSVIPLGVDRHLAVGWAHREVRALLAMIATAPTTGGNEA